MIEGFSRACLMPQYTSAQPINNKINSIPSFDEPPLFDEYVDSVCFAFDGWEVFVLVCGEVSAGYALSFCFDVSS